MLLKKRSYKSLKESCKKHLRQAIEEKYPETKVWETHTPYFEKRNIHFYVNKCGFKIVEYLNQYHMGSHASEDKELPGGEDFFRFEKVMKQ